METRCPNCQRDLRPGMNFCPGCGYRLTTGPAPGGVPSQGMGAPLAPVAGRQGTIHIHAPSQGPYPMPYFPAPAMYAPPMTSKRGTAVASAVIMLIAAVFVLIAGLVYTFEGLWWDDFWVALGILCFVGFSMAIVGAIAIARRAWRLAPLVADGLMISIGAFSLVDLGFLGLIILVLAIIAVVLLAVSWGQFDERFAHQYPMPYMMPPQGMGGPPGTFPMASPPGMGAPPPTMTAPPPGGAPPPRPVPATEEEDLIVDAYVGE